MKPLLDGDILRYEIGFSAEFDDEGNNVIMDFDRCKELLDAKISLICDEVDATDPPRIYLTADKHLVKMHNRRAKWFGRAPMLWEPNFRDKIAVTKPYKGNRKKDKPFHFHNIGAYILTNYEYDLASGIEADDLMAMEQTLANRPLNDLYSSVICSRDKDLRQVPGWHYSWECGKQPSIGPFKADQLGHIEMDEKGKVFGYGSTFFYFQTLAGDAVDNIPGVRGVGPKKAYQIIKESEGSERSLFDGVCSVYKDVYGDDFKPYMKEQFNLLWLIRDWDLVDNEPVYYRPPK